VNHACKLIWRVGVGAGDAGARVGCRPADCAALGALLTVGEAELDDVDPPLGTGPSDPAGAAPHPALTKPAV